MYFVLCFQQKSAKHANIWTTVSFSQGLRLVHGDMKSLPTSRDRILTLSSPPFPEESAQQEERSQQLGLGLSAAARDPPPGWVPGGRPKGAVQNGPTRGAPAEPLLQVGKHNLLGKHDLLGILS